MLHESRVRRTGDDAFLSRLERAERSDQKHREEVRSGISSQVAQLAAAKKARRAQAVAQAEDAELVAGLTADQVKGNRRAHRSGLQYGAKGVSLDRWAQQETHDAPESTDGLLQGATAAAQRAYATAYHGSSMLAQQLASAGQQASGQVLGGAREAISATMSRIDEQTAAVGVRDLAARAFC